jgi:hypothetical protein
MIDLTINDEEPEEREIDFSVPEDVLIRVYKDEHAKNNRRTWNGWGLECVVLDNGTNITGAASYEASYSGFLDYTIMDIIDCPMEEGYYVVPNVTAVYIKGDGWTTDDEMKFYSDDIREATTEEISQF